MDFSDDGRQFALGGAHEVEAEEGGDVEEGGDYPLIGAQIEAARLAGFCGVKAGGAQGEGAQGVVEPGEIVLGRGGGGSSRRSSPRIACGELEEHEADEGIGGFFGDARAHLVIAPVSLSSADEFFAII